MKFGKFLQTSSWPFSIFGRNCGPGKRSNSFYKSTFETRRKIILEDKQLFVFKRNKWITNKERQEANKFTTPTVRRAYGSPSICYLTHLNISYYDQFLVKGPVSSSIPCTCRLLAGIDGTCKACWMKLTL